MKETLTNSPVLAPCPPWCSDLHQIPDAGGEHWSGDLRSVPLSLHALDDYLDYGMLPRLAEICLLLQADGTEPQVHLSHGDMTDEVAVLTLDEAEQLARGLLKAVAAARGEAPAEPAHRPWCGAAVDYPDVVPTSDSPRCCAKDVRNARNRQGGAR